jgi:hypothetical protein
MSGWVLEGFASYVHGFGLEIWPELNPTQANPTQLLPSIHKPLLFVNGPLPFGNGTGFLNCPPSKIVTKGCEWCTLSGQREKLQIVLAKQPDM